MNTVPFVGAFVAAVVATVPACGGVSYRLRTDVAMPATIAVLPFAGVASPGLRDSARQLLHSRLRTLGYRVPELAWVDRVLTERGWLRDPERFDARDLSADAATEALAVDALFVGRDLDETSFNVVVLRRHAVSGALALRGAAGQEHWSAEHRVGSFGGFLLTSGQVLTELRAQGEHGTATAAVALVDEFVADVVGTLPRPAARPVTAPLPAVADVTISRSRGPDGLERCLIEASAPADATVTCDLLPFASGVPMVAQPGRPDRFRGEHDVAAGTNFARVVVRARDAFGREASAEAAR